MRHNWRVVIKNACAILIAVVALAPLFLAARSGDIPDFAGIRALP